MTHSPTRRRPTSPTLMAGRPVASIFTSATSLRLSAPKILALNSRLSVRVTKTSSAPSTTWALVMIKPSDEKMKPEPTPLGCSSSGAGRLERGAWRGILGMGRPKRRKNSSISSSPGPPGAARGTTFSSVRMLTTDGPTISTKSVKSGKVRTWAVAACQGARATVTVVQTSAKDAATVRRR